MCLQKKVVLLALIFSLTYLRIHYTFTIKINLFGDFQSQKQIILKIDDETNDEQKRASMLIIHIASTALYGSLNIYEKHSYFRKPEFKKFKKRNERKRIQEKKRKNNHVHLSLLCTLFHLIALFSMGKKVFICFKKYSMFCFKIIENKTKNS